VQMAKSDPEAQMKSSLSDCTWLENEFGSFNLEALKFLMHLREPGSHFILFLHILTFFLIHIFFLYFFFSHTYIFVLSLFFSFFFLSHQNFFICSP
jgi:hypothetical protein